MKRFLMMLALAAAATLAGCGSTGATSTTESPAQLVFAAKSGYATALTAAVAYKRLPACAPAAPMPCSDPVVVAQLQRADNVAAAALDAAEAAVRTPALGAGAVAGAIQAAQAALTAFTSITTTLKVTQ